MGKAPAVVLSLAVLAALVVAFGPRSASAAKRGPKCKSFATQLAAQKAFMRRGGSPAKRIGGLDPNRNGVACERLAGPYSGYVDVELEPRRHFIYGTVALPRGSSGPPFACIYNNAIMRIFRKVTLVKQAPGPDRAIISKGTAPSGAGSLEYKIENVRRGKYYVEVIASTKEPIDCPTFRSRVIRVGR